MPHALPARLLLLLLVPLSAIVASWFGLSDVLSWSALARDRDALASFAAARPVESALLYIALFVVSALLCLPAGALLIGTAGLLFGAWRGGALAALGSTLGALSVFLLARGVLGRRLLARAAAAGPISRIQPRLARDGVWFLIALRLVPMLPFWLVNVTPALVGMRLRPFLLGSVAGIVPTCLAFASGGAAIGAIIDAGQSPSAASLLTAPVLVPLLALSVLSLVPVAIRSFRTVRPAPCPATSAEAMSADGANP